jgi:hypothetical protein
VDGGHGVVAHRQRSAHTGIHAAAEQNHRTGFVLGCHRIVDSVIAGCLIL